MTRLRARFRPVLVAAAAAVCLVPLITAAPATAVSADVVVSELMYAPDEDAEFNALEFIELTNTGAGAIDLGDGVSALESLWPQRISRSRRG